MDDFINILGAGTSSAVQIISAAKGQPTNTTVSNGTVRTQTGTGANTNNTLILLVGIAVIGFVLLRK